MKTCSKCGETKEFSEYHKHRRHADGLVSMCKPCTKVVYADKYKRYGERIRESGARWKAANPERTKELSVEWRAENRERANRTRREWAYRNLDKKRKSSADYKKRNPAANNAQGAGYRAKRLQATPSWVEEFLIEEAYDLAQRRSKVFGFDWHVDHIVPLKSSLVCGLHVHNNLQVIPGKENASKNNRHWPDMPGL